MFHKFKTTTYATLLLIGVFVLPYAGNVADVNAENYNCIGKPNKVRQCFMEIIRERDIQIAQMQDQLKVATSDTERSRGTGTDAQCKELEQYADFVMQVERELGAMAERLVGYMYRSNVARCSSPTTE